MPSKTVTAHLKHLEEAKIIEYEKGKRRKIKRGSRRHFRLSSEYLSRKQREIVWCKEVHGLIQKALINLGNSSIEQQLSQYDIGLIKFRPPVKGMFYLEYSSRPYLENKNQAYRGLKAQDMLLEIKWYYINPKHVNFTIQIHPNQRMPQFTPQFTLPQ